MKSLRERLKIIDNTMKDTETPVTPLLIGRGKYMSKLLFQQIKEHFIIFLCIVTLLSGIFVYTRNQILSEQVAALEAEREVTQSQIATLFLSMDDRERMTLLDRELLRIPSINARLSKDVPIISKKIIDLHHRYEGEGLRANIILGVIEVESAFTHDAVSYGPKTNQPIAYGFMQLTASTAKTLLEPKGLSWSRELMFNPTFNIELGTELLHILHSSYMERGLEKVNEFNLTLATYNLGERAVLDSYYTTGRLPAKGRDYVAKVNMARKRWIMLGF